MFCDSLPKSKRRKRNNKPAFDEAGRVTKWKVKAIRRETESKVAEARINSS
jgi:hypothetical protein